MRKWIQTIVTLLVVVLFCMPLTTVPMDRTAPAATQQPTAVPEVTAEVISAIETAAADATQAAAAEPTAEAISAMETAAEPTAVPAQPTAEATAEPTAVPTPTAEPTPVPELPACIPVNTGARDADGDTTIAQIQQRLIDLNFLTGTADGVFGANSTDAVFKFQAANGLLEYGVVDETTYYALFSDTAVAAPEPTPEPMGFGASGADVSQVQQKLALWGFLAFEPDGSYGEGTQTGVETFQKYLHDFGETLANEEAPSLLAANQTPTPEPTEEPTPEPTATPEPTESEPTPQPTLPASLPLVLGSRDDAVDTSVAQVQQRLIDLGYLRDVADGAYGQNSFNAVKLFQANMGLSQTGIVDESTYKALLWTAAPANTGAPVEPTATPYVPSGVVDDELLDYLANGRFDVYRMDVKNGDQNEEAFRVQRRLACLDYIYTTDCDGAFGGVTELALKYFQRRNGLPETGIADEATQKVLFSQSALKSAYVVHAYKVTVDVSDQRVYAYQWTGDSYTTDPVKTFVCSTGAKDTPTPLGTYSADGRAGGQWYYFKEFDCYAQWATRIFGGILFHSVTFSEPDEDTISKGAVRNLGRAASHGCIRLTVEDAKWIYDNCPEGFTVTIQE